MIEKQTVERAERFQDEDDCFIHVEMKGGEGCEVLIAGTGKAIMYGMLCAVEKLAKFAESDFDEAVEALRAMQKICNMEEIGPIDVMRRGPTK